jgi:Tfp pilus assembly protein PilO
MKKKKVLFITLGIVAVSGIAYFAYWRGRDAEAIKILETVLAEGKTMFTFRNPKHQSVSILMQLVNEAK